MMSNLADETLLTWIHLSDIHCGQGDKLESVMRRDVLSQTIEDAKKISRSIGAMPDFALISGDLFQSGGNKQAEFDELNEFSNNLITNLEIKDGIYCVPGNHDLDREIERNNNNVRRLLDSLRAGNEMLDTSLTNPEEECYLSSRFKNYSDWIIATGCNKNAIEISPIAWERVWPVEKLKIRLRGLNSAWISMNTHDQGILQMHLDSLERRSRTEPDGIIELITFHHHYQPVEKVA